MARDYFGITIPEEFKRILPSEIECEQFGLNDTEVIRDSSGLITAVNYYKDEIISRQVLYEGNIISEIRDFCNGVLIKKRVFKEEILAAEYFYKKNGELMYLQEYEYQLDKISALTRICGLHKRRAEFKYDQLDRISLRTVFIDNKLCLSQHYIYDALNRIIGYEDDNYKVFVESFSSNNELRLYRITDKLNNEVIVKNRFSQEGYEDTELVINGTSKIVSNIQYVDNVMIKKPTENMDELDLIISKLFNQTTPQNLGSTQRAAATAEERLKSNLVNLIEYKSRVKVLPLALRKWLLYEQAVNASG